MSTQKRQCMIVTKEKNIPSFNLWVHHTKIRQVNWFSYLRSLITSDGRGDREIKRRIAMSRKTSSKIKKILCNPKITVATRLRVWKCYVLLVLKYGSETWTVSKEMENRIIQAEMWFLCRLLRIGWESHTTNEGFN